MKKLLFLILVFVPVFTGLVYPKDSGYRKTLKDGLELYNDGKYGEAKTVFEQLIQKYPRRPEAYSSLGLVHISSGEYTTAADKIKNSIEQDEDYAHGYYLLGRVQEELEDYSDAIENYNKYLELESEFRPPEREDEVKKKIEFLKEIAGGE